MKLPEEIRVGPYAYRVIKDHRFKDDTDCRGTADHDELEIRLAGTTTAGNPISETGKAEVSLHELLHCVDCVFLPKKNRLDEAQITQIAKGLLDTLRRNQIDLLDTTRD